MKRSYASAEVNIGANVSRARKQAAALARLLPWSGHDRRHGLQRRTLRGLAGPGRLARVAGPPLRLLREARRRSVPRARPPLVARRDLRVWLLTRPLRRGEEEDPDVPCDVARDQRGHAHPEPPQ